MNNFLYDFRYAPFKQLFKNYWMVLIFSPIAISALLVILCGNLWMAMMAGLCNIDFYMQYFPHPFGEDDVEVRMFIPIFLFGVCYFCLLFFRKIWLFIPSVFFLTFAAEIVNERIIHNGYDYIGDEYFVFTDNNKIGVKNFWRNTIIPPTYDWYLPCFEYAEDGDYDHKLNPKLILCIFRENEKYYAFTRYEQIIEVERIVFNPIYRKEKKVGMFDKKDNNFVTLSKKKRRKKTARSVWSFEGNPREEYLLGYLMSVNNFDPSKFEGRNTAEYHFINGLGGYLCCGKYYFVGENEEEEYAIAFSNDKKSWDMVSMHHDDVIYCGIVTNETEDKENDAIFDYDGIFPYGVYLSNLVRPSSNHFILESNISSESKTNNINNSTTSDPTYYPTTHMVAKPQTCGICSGTGSCTTCYGRGIISIGSDYIKCGACGGRGRCATCNGSGISGTVQVLEYY